MTDEIWIDIYDEDAYLKVPWRVLSLPRERQKKFFELTYKSNQVAEDDWRKILGSHSKLVGASVLPVEDQVTMVRKFESNGAELDDGRITFCPEARWLEIYH